MSSRKKRGTRSASTKCPEGLHNSPQNALRHGLAAKTLVLSNESQTKFDELIKAFTRKFLPAGEVELELLTAITAARWRLRRIWLTQTDAIDFQMDRMAPEIDEQFQVISHPSRLSLAVTTMASQDHSLQLHLPYETTYSRAFGHALKTLDKMQVSRTKSTPFGKLRNEPDPPGSRHPTARSPCPIRPPRSGSVSARK